MCCITIESAKALDATLFVENCFFCRMVGVADVARQMGTFGLKKYYYKK